MNFSHHHMTASFELVLVHYPLCCHATGQQSPLDAGNTLILTTGVNTIPDFTRIHCRVWYWGRLIWQRMTNVICFYMIPVSDRVSKPLAQFSSNRKQQWFIVHWFMIQHDNSYQVSARWWIRRRRQGRYGKIVNEPFFLAVQNQKRVGNRRVFRRKIKTPFSLWIRPDRTS